MPRVSHSLDDGKASTLRIEAMRPIVGSGARPNSLRLIASREKSQRISHRRRGSSNEPPTTTSLSFISQGSMVPKGMEIEAQNKVKKRL